MILLIIGTSFLLLLIQQFYWKRRNLPPGPTSLPLLGNLVHLYFHEPGYDAFIKWGKEYNGVYTFWFGPIPSVVLSDFSLMKKHIQMDGDKYADRWYVQEMLDTYRGGQYGIIESAGSFWRDQRRFTLHVLRDFGMGRNLMERRVVEELNALYARINKQKGVLLMHDTLDMAVGSIINNLLFGVRFDEKNQDLFFEVKATLEKQSTDMMNPIIMLLFTFPEVKNLPYFSGKYAQIMGYRDVLFGFFRKQIEDRRREVDLDAEESQDFVEVYLKEQHRRREEEDFGGYSNKQLENVVFDLWLAGLETTSNTMTWGFVYLVNHPDVVSKMQLELHTVVGRDRMVLLPDKSKLIYCMATISEIQRLTNIISINLSRMSGEEVDIEGHIIPKGTAIIPQISCALYDEKAFPDPYAFNPDRFVDENGKYKNIPEFVPFSLGKRQCAGEGLARMELFLFITNIIHRYDLPKGIGVRYCDVTYVNVNVLPQATLICDEIPTMKKTFKNVAHAENFTCKFVERLI